MKTQKSNMLSAAIKGDHQEMVISALGDGADINAICNQGLTPLMMALSMKNSSMVRFLIDQGADVDCASQGITPLIMAMTTSQNAMVQLLVDKGASTNCTWRGYTPLLIAAKDGLTQIADILIKADADVNIRTPDGLTVLMIAATSGSTEIIENLLANGADASATTEKGAVVLGFAKHYKHQAAVEIIEKHLGIHDYGISPDLMNSMAVLNVDKEEESSSDD